MVRHFRTGGLLLFSFAVLLFAAGRICAQESDEDFFLPAPTALGQTSPKMSRMIEIGYSYRTRPSESPQWRGIQRETVQFWYESAAI